MEIEFKNMEVDYNQLKEENASNQQMLFNVKDKDKTQ